MYFFSFLFVFFVNKFLDLFMPNLKGKILIIALLIVAQYIQRTMGCGASSNIKAAGTTGKGKGKRTSSSTSHNSHVKHHPNEKTKSQTKSSKVSILFCLFFISCFHFSRELILEECPTRF